MYGDLLIFAINFVCKFLNKKNLQNHSLKIFFTIHHQKIDRDFIIYILKTN